MDSQNCLHKIFYLEYCTWKCPCMDIMLVAVYINIMLSECVPRSNGTVGKKNINGSYIWNGEYGMIMNVLVQ